jgi:hypothetical protein
MIGFNAIGGGGFYNAVFGNRVVIIKNIVQSYK